MPHTILFCLPGPDWKLNAAVQAFRRSTRLHRVLELPSAQASGNFNICLTTALNLFENGDITHMAMQHSDIVPIGWTPPERNVGFLDVLIEEMESKGCVLCSAAVRVKDPRGLFSCGILDPNDSWRPWKRFTAHELAQMPETFTAEDIGEGERGLFHNNGLWVADLRDPRWLSTNADGELLAMFDYRARISRRGEKNWWGLDQESEDQYFSRMVKSLGIPSCITQKIHTVHIGPHEYGSRDPGEWEHDRELAFKWSKP